MKIVKIFIKKTHALNKKRNNHEQQQQRQQ